MDNEQDKTAKPPNKQANKLLDARLSACADFTFPRSMTRLSITMYDYRLSTIDYRLPRQEHQNALMTKRFLFEAFDSYISLFYLAFVQVRE